MADEFGNIESTGINGWPNTLEFQCLNRPTSYEFESDNIGSSTGGDGIHSKFNAHLVPIRITECVMDKNSYTT
jgi:hypothetical protein